MPTSVTGYTFIYNALKYQFPLVAAVQSLLAACDEVIVCECFSEDNTWELVNDLANLHPRLKLVRHPWGDHSSVQSKICNFIIQEHVKTDWHFKLDADEVLHDESAVVLKPSLEVLDKQPWKGVTAVRPHYTHFVANYWTTFPFIYDRVIRIARKDAGWFMPGDACQLTGGRGQVIDLDIEVFHYGKVRSGPTALMKEKDFQQLYVDQGFPDPKLAELEKEIGEVDWFYLFQNSYGKGEFKPFTGHHPLWMIPVILAEKDEKQYRPIMELEADFEYYCGYCQKVVDGPNCDCGRRAVIRI